jgi:hypothetical protein
MEDSEGLTHFNILKFVIFNIVLLGVYHGNVYGIKSWVITLFGITITIVSL